MFVNEIFVKSKPKLNTLRFVKSIRLNKDPMTWFVSCVILVSPGYIQDEDFTDMSFKCHLKTLMEKK